MNRFYNGGYTAKVFILLSLFFGIATYSSAQIDINISWSARVAPPELPVYEQPECPGDDYIWTPGYWAYGDDDYYWVPGVWVEAPEQGYLWTPNYWAFEDDGFYRYHAGYWGPHIGFYGGINYGYGYNGDGYYGGRWDGGHFRYNTAVSRVNVTIVHNTYIDRTVMINNNTINNHTSFNGRGGIDARPRPEQQQAANDRHIRPTSQQYMHQQNAGKDKSQFAKENHGRPAIAAMDKVGGSRYTPQGRPAMRTTSPVRARPLQNKTQPAKQVNPRDINGRRATRPGARSVTPSRQPAVKQPQRQPVPQHNQPQTRQPKPQVRPTTQPAQRPIVQPRPPVRPKPQVKPQQQKPQPRPQPKPQAQPKQQPPQKRP